MNELEEENPEIKERKARLWAFYGMEGLSDSVLQHTQQNQNEFFFLLAGICLVCCELFGYWAWRSVTAGRQQIGRGGRGRERERERVRVME